MATTVENIFKTSPSGRGRLQAQFMKKSQPHHFIIPHHLSKIW